ncbi:MAG: RimK family alpha-L-glutamate ligase [Candidatus Heimdallarchaeota archaeon]|nr:MAG: RimK family alpha-L-glutamate ligase [Candidatus Heimdallarchaeota archaeon]
MNLGILSRNREYFPTNQLLDEIERRKDTSGVFLSTRFVSPLISHLHIDALFAGQSLKLIDGLVPRIGRSQTEIGLLCLQQFELLELPTTISARALFLARDKFRCYQTLHKVPGVRLPKTVLMSTSYMFERIIQLFKFPVVIKILDATRGAGTILAPNRRVAQEIIDALFLRYDQPIMVQEYLQGQSTDRNQLIEDIRVLIVGETILGAMRRIAPKGEWRTNYAQGASCKPHQLSSEDKELVLRIVETIGIEVAGIDLYPTDKGLFLLEVNACPGWKAFESVHPKVNVAKSIIDYLLAKIRQ